MGTQQSLDAQAGTAVAEINGALLSLRRPRRDWRSLTVAMRKSLGRLGAAELIRNDAQARAILSRIAAARSLPTLKSEVALLSARVSQLIENKKGRKRPTAGDIASGRRTTNGEGRAEEFSERAPTRRFLHL